MISFHRPREGPPFLGTFPLRNLGGLPYFHSTLRQGLYGYFLRAGRQRALLPDFCPEGIYAPLRDAGLKIAFYGVGPDLSLDRGGLRRMVESFRPDVFLYIHHFGLRLEGNLRLVRESLNPGTLLVEDLAHTLPEWGFGPPTAPDFGDLALYAFPKLLGVAEGGLLLFRRADPAATVPYGPESGPGRTLARRLEAHLAYENWVRRLRLSPRLQSLLRHFVGKRADYYGHLMRHYRDIASPVSAASLRVLERVDFQAIGARRRAVATQYWEGLDPRFRLGPPREAYLQAPLLAFPIKVDDQDRFHAHLAKAGVLGFRLTDRWWFPPEAPGALYHGHYLLPMGHHLGDGEIRAVIARANLYPKAQRAR